MIPTPQMPSIAPERAKDLLNARLAELQPLSTVTNPTVESLQFRKWRRNTLVCINNIFGDGSSQSTEFNNLYFASGIFTYDPEDQTRLTRLNFDAYARDCVRAQALLESMLTELELFGDLRANPAPDSLEQVRVICQRFPLVARQLRSRHDDRDTLAVEDEYDVQDLMHALLCLIFDDIRPEEWTPSYAGAASRMDFLLKPQELVVETKKTRPSLTAREIGEQLIVDIEKYSKHPSCKTLCCFVYDPENRIPNPRGIEADLSRDGDGLRVSVLIAP